MEGPSSLSATPSVCPTCQEAVRDPVARCPACRTGYHEACLQSMGCLVPGCRRPTAAIAVEPERSPAWRLVNWSLVGLVGCLIGAVAGERAREPWLTTGLLAGAGLSFFVTVLSTFWATAADIRTGAARQSPSGTAGLMLLAAAPILAALVAWLRPDQDAVIAATMLATGVAAVCGLVGVFADRRKLRALTSVLIGGLLALTSVIAVPGFRSARGRATTRACYANQKTIAGAIEMYNLDQNTKREPLDERFWHALRSGGYLASIPQDPGQGPGTTSHYQLTATGNGIRCTVHGSVR